MNPLKVDGTTLEGGGQLVRLVIGLAALTNRSVELVNIRGGRLGGGGLKSQHLSAVRWLAKSVRARVEGMELKSKRLLFEPLLEPQESASSWWEPVCLADGTPARSVVIDMGSPGSITLVLQATLPFLLFWPCEAHWDDHGADAKRPTPVIITLKGGTNVPFSPSIDYVAQVFAPNLSVLGLPRVSLLENGMSRGWATGRPEVGSVTFLVHPVARGATMDALAFPRLRSAVKKLSVTTLAPGVLARRKLQSFVTEVIEEKVPESAREVVEFVVDEDSKHEKRLYLLIVAHTQSGIRLGYDWLYDQKIAKGFSGLADAMQRLAKTVVQDLCEEIGEHGEAPTNGLDRYMMDQVPVFMALAKGKSSIGGDSSNLSTAGGGSDAPSLHTLTARWAAGKLLGVDFLPDGSCEGAAFSLGAQSADPKIAETASGTADLHKQFQELGLAETANG